jgi:hypothetical protein
MDFATIIEERPEPAIARIVMNRPNRATHKTCR